MDLRLNAKKAIHFDKAISERQIKGFFRFLHNRLGVKCRYSIRRAEEVVPREKDLGGGSANQINRIEITGLVIAPKYTEREVPFNCMRSSGDPTKVTGINFSVLEAKSYSDYPQGELKMFDDVRSESVIYLENLHTLGR